MPLDHAIIQKVIDEADIASIICEYIKLEKKGGDFKGICPFHNDSNPSLSVSPTKKVFKCFSCNAAGNVIGFVERFKQIPFLEALKIVADKVGIKLDLQTTTSDENRKYYDITKEVTKFYQFFLNNTKEGQNALEYLHKRGIDEDIIKRFQIGFAGSNRQLLVKTFVDEKGYLPVDLRTLELIKKRSGMNDYYDTFSNRIIFPIDDFYGNIVGFSGRIFDHTSKESKYINSPESKIFKKGNLLYNYSRSVSEIKRLNSVFIFEGFMDVIAAYKAGVVNTVATMGTALTKNQAKSLVKLTKNVVVCYDGDNAGIMATINAIKLFHELNINVKAVCIPDAMDPDEYQGKYGITALNEYLQNKQLSSIDYIYKIEKDNMNIDDPISVDNFKKRMIQHLKYFNSTIITASITKRMAADLEVDSSVLNEEYNATNEVVEPYFEVPQTTSTYKPRQKRRYLIAEEHIIYSSIHNKQHCLYVRDNLPVGIYVDKINRNILYKLYDYYGIYDEFNKDTFIKELDDEAITRLELIIDPRDKVSIEKIELLVNILKDYEYEKISNQLLERKTNQDLSIDDVKQLAMMKQKLVKFKNKKE